VSRSTQNNISRLSQSRLDEIGELAEFIAEERWTAKGLNLQALLKEQGMTLSFNTYAEAFDGLLEYKGGRFHVYCNLDRVERPDSARARFTLGHELGHYYLDDHRRALESGSAKAHASFCDYESRIPAEREADHFASNLLMPTKRFRKEAARAGRGLAGILRLREAFQTSITSTAIRFASLNISPCALVKWKAEGISWKWLSGDTREAGYRTTFTDPRQLVPGSPTTLALAGQLPPQGFFESGTTAAAWFPFVSDGSTQNVILIEQAIPLGRFGVLTFLYPESGDFSFWPTSK